MDAAMDAAIERAIANTARVIAKRRRAAESADYELIVSRMRHTWPAATEEQLQQRATIAINIINMAFIITASLCIALLFALVVYAAYNDTM